MSWVKPSEIAELVDVSPSTVTRWCHREDDPLPHVRWESTIRINTNDFWTWWLKDYRKSKVMKVVEFNLE